MIERRVGRVEGVVQGVGFRPYVARLATSLGLGGCVRNEGDAVRIEIEGDAGAIARFEEVLAREAPRAARIERTRWDDDVARGERAFVILASDEASASRALTIPADLATCDACRAEVRDDRARRHGYPFTNCTECGPRYSIVLALPYDRARTTMAGFAMCEACRREHDDPTDRRYHAQPIACPRCGPSLRLVARDGATIAARGEALDRAGAAIRDGAIVAVKGLGGWQLACDATSEAAVARLRTRKRRPDKPFAVMVATLDDARRLALVDATAAQALASPSAPIVLVRAKGGLARSIAPGNARVGLMLPTTPLHALLLERTGGPIVCTSGNLHEEPIAIGDGEALARLGEIADAFLGHDRPIARRIDDAVAHVVDGELRVLRLGRGVAPLRFPLDAPGGEPLVCAGAHLKNAPGAVLDRDVVLWPHVGDLDGPLARDALVASLDAMCDVLAIAPAAIACDLHPDYASTIWAEQTGAPLVRVQHHHAHVAACLAEHRLSDALGIAWDGVGLGDDRTAWGGEVLRVDRRESTRALWMRPFPLPGGDAAARDPSRALAGALVAAGLDVRATELGVPERFVAVARSPHLSPITTSVGRLFDAVAAATGVCKTPSFEGQAAIALESIAEPGAPPYPFDVRGGVIDWAPALAALLAERHDAVRAASRFHATLVAMVVAAADRERAPSVALSGGCFQNALLAEQAIAALRERGHRAVLPARVPPNDGGLALGQAWVARHRLARDRGGSPCA